MTAESCCIDWACPQMSCICLPTGVQMQDITDALEQANSTIHDASNRRYPGTGCRVKLRPCVACYCGFACGASCKRAQIDLYTAVNYPILELLDVTINGQPLDDLNGWRIADKRWLVKPNDQPWPQQLLQLADGQESTWSVTVRYGAVPPAELLKARDQLFYRELARCHPTAVTACGDSVLLETVTDKTGTKRKKETEWIDMVRQRFGQKRRRSSFYNIGPETGTEIVPIEVVELFPAETPLCDADVIAAAITEQAQSQAGNGVDPFGLPEGGG